MRVLVTGGAGFIGSHIVEQALLQGFEVAVLDDFSTGKRQHVPQQVQLFDCDLRDREATFAAVRSFRPQLVSHQAAQASVAISVKNPRLDAEVNIIGGLNLLDACTADGAHVEQLVFASTGGAIYGEVPEGERAAEDYGLLPKSPYGISKLTFERLLAVYREQRGLRSLVLRYANVYGPRQDPQGEAGVVASFFAAAFAGKKLSIFAKQQPGDGGCVRDYVYVADVARANLLALSGQLAERVMNVGTGQATTTLALAERILQLCASSSAIEQAAARAGDLERSVLDAQRFERALGAPTSLAVGLNETCRWYRER
jgi:UDP-glucose 4-epimerase